MKIGKHILAVGGLALALAATNVMAQDTSPILLADLSDMSGPVMDLSGPGTTVALQMAIDDFGGTVLGRPIQLLTGDHLNKPDVGVSIARKWYDSGVSAIFDVGLSSVALGVQDLAREKNKLVFFVSSGTGDLTGKNCSPNGIQWTFDTYAQSKGLVDTIVKQGGDSWYFITEDYTYGHNLETQATDIAKQDGATILGSTAYPVEATDLSGELLKAQASGAKIIGLAVQSTHVPNLLKQADEFGIRPGQKLVPLSLQLNDVKAMGMDVAHGLYEGTSYYWDTNDATRAFANRFEQKMNRKPSLYQATAYGAMMHYLKAVKAAGTLDTAAVRAKIGELPIEDFSTSKGYVRADGRAIRDWFILEVKTADESTSDWDLEKLVATIPGDQAFRAPDPTLCPLVK